MTIGENIRKERKRAGLKQEDLAKKVGLATITIRQYEAGKRTPNIPTLRLIAHVLKTPTVVLLGDDQDLLKNLGVSGMDVFIEDAETATIGEVKEMNLINFYQMLNDTGKDVAIARVEELTEIKKYRKGGEDPHDPGIE